MKKLVLILAVVTALTAITGCKKEEDKLVGTKWMTSDIQERAIILEFTSNNDVIGYFVSSNGAILGDSYSGKYSLSGENIIFNDFMIKRYGNWNYYKLQSGIVNGTIMSTKGKESVGDEWFSWNRTWNKQ